MKRINSDLLRPGDIVLTARKSLVSKGIRLATLGDVSHAMITVTHGSVIDATNIGVHARSIRRELFRDEDRIYAFRARGPLAPETLQQIIAYARSQVAVPYSTREAIRTVAGLTRPRERWQFCSRLVAQAFAHAGMPLVPDQDYCSPEDLRVSPLLEDLGDICEPVTFAQALALRRESDPVARMQAMQNQILADVRQLGAEVYTFGELSQLVEARAELDDAIAAILTRSGYLDLWRDDIDKNRPHYDLALLNTLTTPESAEAIRRRCRLVIGEEDSGDIHLAATLAHHRLSQRLVPRQTTFLLLELYDQLVRGADLRRGVARAWLEEHHAEDVATFAEAVRPHSPLWFHLVDLVAPNVTMMARASIAAEGHVEGCTTCGDDATDYRLANRADTMPGVPSLRLCEECFVIRQRMGEILVPFV